MVKTIKQTSAGGVVFKQDENNIKVIIATRQKNKIYCLPKGHIEANESEEQAALREVKEEAGVTAKIIAKIGKISYWFYSKEENARIFKNVHFYLMQYLNGSVSNHDAELEEVNWVDINEANNLLTYKSEKEMMQKAQAQLEGKI